MTSSNGNLFRVTGSLWGESIGHRWIPLTKGQWGVALMFSLMCAWTKPFIKKTRRRWFETPWRSLWCHCNETFSFTDSECWVRTCWRLLPSLNTLRPRQNGRHFADDTFNRIFLKENVRISIKLSLKFVPKSPIDNIPALFQIMAWRRPGHKPLSEPMMVSLLTHICVARPQWVLS